MPRRPDRTGVQLVNVLDSPEPTNTATGSVSDLHPPQETPPAAAVTSTTGAGAHRTMRTVHTRPAPEEQLTPEQRRIRDLENQLAMERGRKDPEPELETAPENHGNILIHFVADGFTALSHVWYRGQELEFAPDSAAYHDTCDKFGRSWLELRDNPAAQEERFGEVKFRSGPWPGKTYRDAAKARFDNLAPLKDGQRLTPSDDELTTAEKAEARRRRAAPRLPLH